MATEKVEMMLRHAEDAFLDRLQVLLSGVGVDDRTLDELVAQSRLARRLYIFDRRARLLHPTAWRAADALVFRPPPPATHTGVRERGRQALGVLPRAAVPVAHLTARPAAGG